MKKFNVINFDFNAKKFEEYNIIPYFVDIYKSIKKKQEKPETFEDFKKFIKDEAHYQFWGRCEYEIILLDWPVQKTEEKWDVYDQILMNIDIITDIVMNECKSSKKTK